MSQKVGQQKARKASRTEKKQLDKLITLLGIRSVT